VACTPAQASAHAPLPPWGVSLAADGWRPASPAGRAAKLESLVSLSLSQPDNSEGSERRLGEGLHPAAELWPDAAALEAAIPRYQRLLAPLLPPADSAEARAQVEAELLVLQQMEPLRSVEAQYVTGGEFGIPRNHTTSSDTTTSWFNEEDYYPATTLSDALRDEFALGFSDRVYAAFDVCSFLVRVMKQQENRLRPHQAAAILNASLLPNGAAAGEGLQPIRAYTSQTGSAPSGHAVQGYCLAGAVYEDLLESPPSWFTPGSDSHNKALTLLYRTAYDVGDRRMIAGVHYPSDNYASATLVNRVLGPVLFPRAQAAGMVFATDDNTRAALCGGVGYPALCTTPALNASTVGVPLPPPLASDAPSEPFWCPPPPPPPPPSRGCMYMSAANYDSNAMEDDGSCVFDCVTDGVGSSSCEAAELCSGNGGHCRRLFAGGALRMRVHLHLTSVTASCIRVTASAPASVTASASAIHGCDMHVHTSAASISPQLRARRPRHHPRRRPRHRLRRRAHRRRRHRRRLRRRACRHQALRRRARRRRRHRRRLHRRRHRHPRRRRSC
jgi:hypothetical protein